VWGTSHLAERIYCAGEAFDEWELLPCFHPLELFSLEGQRPPWTTLGAPFSTGIPGLMLFPLILAFCPGAGVAQFIDTIMVSASAKANPHQIRFLSIRIKVDVLILNKDYT
jgi:hypothetical protein